MRFKCFKFKGTYSLECDFDSKFGTIGDDFVLVYEPYAMYGYLWTDRII